MRLQILPMVGYCWWWLAFRQPEHATSCFGVSGRVAVCLSDFHITRLEICPEFLFIRSLSIVFGGRSLATHHAVVYACVCMCAFLAASTGDADAGEKLCGMWNYFKHSAEN